MTAESRDANGKPPLVKICGIKEETTLRGMAGLRVDYIGFVFAKSRRQVTPERAAQLREASRSVAMAGGQPPLTVGVFVNPTLEQLEQTLAVVPLDAVQLHGDETPEFAREVRERLNVDVWRALPVQDEDDPSAGAAHLETYAGAVSTVLLDTAGGGTGRTFRWDVIPAYRRAAASSGLRLFVAGGLSPDNADELVAAYRPDGVDISSGVETDGAKDNGKIAAFVERVNNA
ncbi:phosphoribosylanthranilate isomerase [Cohnella cellulosilytica]|uniref:N-(5'-phosphoribosyl)anthranilate isomerase n=1 Tax=Cohnella cellulosilytica TaxID=986710 RepID=A0ABW2F5D5_9BACL